MKTARIHDHGRLRLVYGPTPSGTVAGPLEASRYPTQDLDWLTKAHLDQLRQFLSYPMTPEACDGLSLIRDPRAAIRRTVWEASSRLAKALANGPERDWSLHSCTGSDRTRLLAAYAPRRGVTRLVGVLFSLDSYRSIRLGVLEHVGPGFSAEDASRSLFETMTANAESDETVLVSLPGKRLISRDHPDFALTRLALDTVQTCPDDRLGDTFRLDPVSCCLRAEFRIGSRKRAAVGWLLNQSNVTPLVLTGSTSRDLQSAFRALAQHTSEALAATVLDSAQARKLLKGVGDSKSRAVRSGTLRTGHAR